MFLVLKEQQRGKVTYRPPLVLFVSPELFLHSATVRWVSLNLLLSKSQVGPFLEVDPGFCTSKDRGRGHSLVTLERTWGEKKKENWGKKVGQRDIILTLTFVVIYGVRSILMTSD